VPIDDTRSNGQPLSFSNFELDLRARELRKHGTRIKLQDQPFQILALLLEKPGEIVTREELRDRLWPADTFVDFDHSLNSAVKKLRQALNDDPDVPRFIETLPRRGYRFIAPLRNGSSPAPAASEFLQSATGSASSAEISAEPAAASASPPVVAHTHHWKLWAAGGFGFLLALGIVAWFGFSRPTNSSSLAPIRLVPLTSFSNEFSKGSFSPDGNQVAFEWDGDQTRDDPHYGTNIYIKQIGMEKPLQITSASGYNFFPAWSPDGRYIAFLHSGRGEHPGVFLVPALGGTSRKLHDFASGSGFKPGLSWSPDGKFLLFSEQLGDQPYRIEQLNIEDLSVRQLSAPPVPSTGDLAAQFSPDGKSIAFIRNTKDVEDIYVMPAYGGTPRRLTFDNRLMVGLTWTPDSKELIFSSNRGGNSWGLWRMSVAGGTPERVSVGSEGAFLPELSLRGNRLLYASGFWEENIWRIPIGPRHHLGKPERIIFSSTQEEGPQYSPDGKRIVFQSTRSGNFEIWRADADGTNLIQLTSFRGPLTGTPRWSPDGRQIGFDTRPGAHPNIHIISADGGPARRLSNDTSDDAVPSWSHDGRSLYFASNRSGSWQVWKRTVDGGQPVQVTANGGFAAFESPDGKSIYYAKFNEKGIWKAPVSGGEEAKVIDEPPADHWGYFAVGRDGLYYVGDTGTPAKPRPGFKFFDFSTHKITIMGDMEKYPCEGAPGLSVSPDGKYLLVVQVDEERNSLMMAENFR
jgi:Tol biopolymer transport system component/DNA-binding winged helix-turn-helix (wHTH) protein